MIFDMMAASLPFIIIFAILPITLLFAHDNTIDYGNHNLNWEDGQSSWDEYGHDNSACGLPVLTVEEWEAGKYWEGDLPVLVTNVTKGWAALNNWKLQEMLKRYPNAEAKMGDARFIGEQGPDAYAQQMTPTTIKVSDATIYFRLHWIDTTYLSPIEFSCDIFAGVYNKAHVQSTEVLL